MADKKIDIKKTLAFKQESSEEDLLKVIELLEPNDLKSLYLIVVGILTTRGYEIIY